MTPNLINKITKRLSPANRKIKVRNVYYKVRKECKSNTSMPEDGDIKCQEHLQDLNRLYF